MLAKIEELYLQILRAAILVVAGLVLLAAAAAFSAAIFNGARSLLFSASQARASGLAQFVAEKRLFAEAMNGGGAEASSASAAQPQPLAPGVADAAGVLARHAGRSGGNAVAKAELTELLNGLWLATPAAHQHAYEAGLRRLAGELSASTGRPLSRDRVLELVQWHHQSLLAEAGRLEQEKAAASADAWTWIGRAAQAFLLFVGIAFYFLLVRVERHLRLVRTQQVGPSVDPPAISPAGAR